MDILIKKKAPYTTIGIRGGLGRGSTLIYHFGFLAFRSRTHVPASILLGFPACDPGSLLDQILQYSFRSTRYSFLNYSIIPDYPLSSMEFSEQFFAILLRNSDAIDKAHPIPL